MNVRHVSVKRFSRSEVKFWRHSEAKCIFPAAG